MKKCDIIIAVWNRKELTTRCINSIFANTHCDYKLIIVDNASDPPTRDYLAALEASHKDKIILIRNEENLGYPKAVNRGIRASSADYACIINNDIIVFDGWLEEMIAVAQSSVDIGIVNPSNNFGRKKPWNKSYQQYASEMTVGEKGQYSETASPVGFCYLIKREVINKIGVWDERYSPGYFEDTEYALRANKAGYRSVFAKGAFVFHFEHSSFKKRRFNSLFKQSEEKFYALHKRPERILFLLTDRGGRYYGRVKEDSYILAKDSNWVSIYLKKSAPKIDLYDHTYMRAFRFSDAFFNLAAIIKIVAKKKKFSRILVDDEKLAKRLNGLKKYHKAKVELLT